MNLLNEVLDEEKLDLPVTNLYPKTKIPQIFAVGAIDDGGNTPAFRMCSYTSGGDTNKNVKPGDKMIHVVMLTLSEKGSLVKLKNLGDDPVGTISTTFNIVYDAVKTYKMDAVLFRMNKTKVGGQARQLQVIMDRLVRTRTGGKFVILKELWDYDKKYSYILIHRKSVDLSTVPGVPEISTELFTKVESNVGEVYVNKKSGNTVSKSEAIAASIAQVNDKRTDNNVIARAKISRRAIAASQSVESNRTNIYGWEEYDETAGQYSAPATAPLIPQASELVTRTNGEVTKARMVQWASKNSTQNAFYHVSGLYGKDGDPRIAKIEQSVASRMTEVYKKHPPASVEALEAYTKVLMENYDLFKEDVFEKASRQFEHLSKWQARDEAQKVFNRRRTKALKEALAEYSKAVSEDTYMITMLRSPEQYTSKQKGAIRLYCGSAYSDINNMLLGRYDDENFDSIEQPEVESAIKNLDEAFLNGDRLPEGITLYRAQTMRAPIFEAMIKNKVFYFRNYVSTSLYPIIFGGWKNNVAVGLVSTIDRDTLNADYDPNPEKIQVPDIQKAEYEKDASSLKIPIGWAISGANKINVIYPGDLSSMTQEQEIILPRGTMLKLNKITNASYNDGIDFLNERFIQAEILTSDQLSEAEVIYDGDMLIETGEVVEYKDACDFSLFVESTAKASSTEALSMLASCIDITDIPRRFVD